MDYVGPYKGPKFIKSTIRVHELHFKFRTEIPVSCRNPHNPKPKKNDAFPTRFTKRCIKNLMVFHKNLHNHGKIQHFS